MYGVQEAAGSTPVTRTRTKKCHCSFAVAFFLFLCGYQMTTKKPTNPLTMRFVGCMAFRRAGVRVPLSPPNKPSQMGWISRLRGFLLSPKMFVNLPKFFSMTTTVTTNTKEAPKRMPLSLYNFAEKFLFRPLK